jgi:hypothetical protein
MVRAAALLALALPAPALAQGFPPQCIVVRQCAGETCVDNPGFTLAFAAAPGRLTVRDVEEPQTRVALTALPGPGPDTWVGRAPDGAGALMITRIGPDQAVLSQQSEDLPDPILTARLSCASVQPPPTKRGAA